jgi:hypothetical protein
VLLEDGIPHADQLEWLPLGPLDLGLGTFMEVACFDRASGSLLVTDALVSIPAEPPAVFDLDPTPLLFHARDRGDEPLTDSPEHRRRGWKRIVLFASYLRPELLDIASLRESLGGSLAPGCRDSRSHFGFYPFRWREGWEREAEALLTTPAGQISVAPVLERLVFPRCRAALLAWIRSLAACERIRWLVPAHFDAPLAISSARLEEAAHHLQQRDWAPTSGSWAALAGIDRFLIRLGVVPQSPGSPEGPMISSLPPATEK